MATFGPGSAKKAPEPPTPRVGTREAWLHEPVLHEWGRGIRPEAAAGVDRSRAQAEERQREEHRPPLGERRRRKRSRATRVSRRDIPPGEGKRRP